MRPGSIVGGAVLLAVGGAMLLDRSGLMHVQDARLVAPIVLIALGTAILLERGVGSAAVPAGQAGPAAAQPAGAQNSDRLAARHGARRRHKAGGGLWLIFIGAWMLISEQHLFGLDYHTSWPLFLVAIGLLMVLRAWD
jgi:predicted tellurium resistance membrane protein TerC